MTNKPMKHWKYGSVNLGGNLHDVARFLNEFHPAWDVICVERAGSNTVVLYRTEVDEQSAKPSIPKALDHNMIRELRELHPLLEDPYASRVYTLIQMYERYNKLVMPLHEIKGRILADILQHAETVKCKNRDCSLHRNMNGGCTLCGAPCL